MSFSYVASPYSHPDPLVRQMRYEEVLAFCAGVISKGMVVYSPIVHCHNMAVQYDLPKEFDFWQVFDLAMLRQASSLIVLKTDGWKESRGIAGEVAFANKINLPIHFVNAGANAQKAFLDARLSRMLNSSSDPA